MAENNSVTGVITHPTYRSDFTQVISGVWGPPCDILCCGVCDSCVLFGPGVGEPPPPPVDPEVSQVRWDGPSHELELGPFKTSE